MRTTHPDPSTDSLPAPAGVGLPTAPAGEDMECVGGVCYPSAAIITLPPEQDEEAEAPEPTPEVREEMTLPQVGVFARLPWRRLAYETVRSLPARTDAQPAVRVRHLAAVR